MAGKLQLLRGNTDENNEYTGVPGELTADLQHGTLRLHEGDDEGGVPVSETLTVSNLKELGALPSGFLRDDRNYRVSSFGLVPQLGGGNFRWESDRNKSEHNTATIIDPNRINAWDGTQNDLSTLFEAGSSGSGCFVRIDYSRVTPEMLGAIPGTHSFNHAALHRLMLYDFQVDFGSSEYGITSVMGRGSEKIGAINWISSGCRIYYDGPATSEGMLYFLIQPLDNRINGELTFDGQMLAQGGVRLRNVTDVYGNFYADKVAVRNIRRINNDVGGTGFFVQGAFKSVVLEDITVQDIRMAAGTGVALSQGVGGITISRDSTSGLGALYTRIVNPYVENIESEDLSYNVDQDGIAIMTQPLDDSVWTSFDVVGGSITNCFSRGIKSQTTGGTIQGTHFTRNRGLASGQGNEEIRSQRGCVNVRDITFEYDGFVPTYICTQGISAKNEAGGVIDGINGTVKNAVIPNVLGTYSRQTLNEINVSNISIRGSIERFFMFLIPNSGATLNMQNLYADEVLEEGILARSGGIGTLEVNPNAIINVRNIRNGGSIVPLVGSTPLGPATFDLRVSGQVEGFSDADPIVVSDIVARAKSEGIYFADYAAGEVKALNGLEVESGTTAQVVDYRAPDGQTGVSASGEVLTLGPDIPAIVNGEALQVQPASTNLWATSEGLFPSFITSGATVEGVTVQGPFGGEVAATKITASTVNEAHFAYRSNGALASQGIVGNSIFAVPDGFNTLQLAFRGADSNLYRGATVNLITGGVYGSPLFPSDLASSINVEKLTSGWVKISIADDYVAGESSARILYAIGQDGEYTVGDGTQGVIITGRQNEQGYPTSYIRTEDSAVTRGAVTSRKSLAGSVPSTFSMFFDGTIHGGDGGGTFHGILSLAEAGKPAGETSAISIVEDTDNQRLRLAVFQYGAPAGLFISYPEGYTPGMRLKAVAVMDRNNEVLKFFVNGVKVGDVPIDVTAPGFDNLTEILMGNGLRTENDFGNGSQKRIMDFVVPYALSDREALELTRV